MNTRVLVIGLDGATFEIIEPMVKEGRLPNFARLMRGGSFGPLKSSIPPITPCAWTSFATGKDPSKHGLYDFSHHEGDPRNKKSVNRTFVRAKSLWKILSEAGKRCVVVDVPLTYPPEEINGVLISRVMAPPKKNCAYPKALYYTLRNKGWIKKIERKLADEHGADNANKEEPKARGKPRRMSKARLNKMRRQRVKTASAGMIEETGNNIKLAEWLMKKEEWDFFMMVFMSADHAGHTFWRYQPKVKKIYEKLDEAVGRLFKFAGDDSVKFIMSDHGFTSIPISFNINEWLYKKGLLFKKLRIPFKESLKELKAFLKDKKNPTPADRRPRLTKFRYMIATDYDKSRAYLQSGTSYGIRINLEGRDKTGIVKKDAYGPFREGLINELKDVRHPRTKEKIFSHILKKEEVYPESPFGTDPSPDIFLLPDKMKVMVDGQFRQVTRVFKKTSAGYGFHHTHGVFFAQGKDIRSGRLSPNITDLAPTILHILGVPTPEDMDGRALREIFKPFSEYAKKKIEYQGPSLIDEGKKGYSKKEEEKVKKRLEALGYIE